MATTSTATRKPVTVERTIGGKRLSLESGRLAKQASGSVVVRIGETMTLVATVGAPGREGLDFFPLTVDYREKVYSAGKFPGGFIKREGRPTTKEILTSRLIERPIRPIRTAPVTCWSGMCETCSAALEPIMDRMSGSFSRSADRDEAMIWTSLM